MVNISVCGTEQRLFLPDLVVLRKNTKEMSLIVFNIARERAKLDQRI